MKAIVFGGYGVFGSLVARDLANAGISVIIAGRDRQQAEKAARALSGDHSAVSADVNDAASCVTAIADCRVAVNCSGPFAAANTALLEACLSQKVHYCDISDDRPYCKRVREMGKSFLEHDLTAGWGLSSLPGISGALAVALTQTRGVGPSLDGELATGSSKSPRSARITLFIGNHNLKGRAAIRSAVEMIGSPIEAPQGVIRGFGDFECVELPVPFGARSVLNANSPDYDVLPALIGVSAVRVKVGFELRISNVLFRLLAACGPIWGDRTAYWLSLLARPLTGLGRSGGVIMAELFYADGCVRRGSVSGAEGAQRLAAKPCSIVAEALCKGHDVKRGAVTAYEAIGAQTLLERLTDRQSPFIVSLAHC